MDESQSGSSRQGVGEEELLEFLGDPGSFPHAPGSVRVVHTHGAYVAIAPPFVYKVRKAVDFGFLDYSTLERRLHFAREEIRLNSRLCEDLYLGVIPICRVGGRLRFGDEEPAVEYAVKMRELAPESFLKTMLAEGRAGLAEVDRVVATLVPFYREQPSDPDVAQWGAPEKLRLSTDENFRQVEPFVGKTISVAALASIREFTETFYATWADRLEARVHEGRIVDGHGDLHLEHIHLSPDRVTIYDCIEFNDRFRHLDWASDIAFLAMDLDFEGRPDLAQHLVDRMAREMGDAQVRPLLDFYKCYRAFVRGKVDSMQSEDGDLTGEEREVLRERARRYFRLALRYAVAGTGPLVVVTMGRVGSGKSTLAEALGRDLDWKVVSSDRVRKLEANLPENARTPAAFRPELYSEENTRETYEILRCTALERARHHQCTILDATYSRSRFRDDLRQRLREEAVPVVFLEAVASEATVRERLAARDGDAVTASDARLEDQPQLNAAYEAPAPGEVLTLGTEGPVEEGVASVLLQLARKQAGPGSTEAWNSVPCVKKS